MNNTANKNISKRALCVILALFTVCVMALTAIKAEAASFSTEQLGDVQTDELIVLLGYDVALPEVYLISPTGMEYRVSESTAGMEIRNEAGFTSVRIVAPTRGMWSIRYDKGSNTRFNFSIVTATENIWLQSVTAVQSSAISNMVSVSFLATREGYSAQTYDYRMYLAYESGNSSRVQIHSGSARTGETKSVSVSLRDYDSYDKYVIIIEVEMNDNGTILHDSYSSEPFAFTNPNTVSAPDSVRVSIDTSERALTLSWNEYSDGYLVNIVGNNGETVLDAEYSDEISSCTAYVSDSISDVTVNFYRIVGNRRSEPYTRTLSMSGGLKLLTPELTASSQAQFEIDLPADTVLSVSVNEGTPTEFKSNGAPDTVAVTITNGQNKVLASYTSGEITYKVEKDIYRDGFAPTIDFFEPYANRSFPDGQAVLVGSVGDAVSFTVNGSPVEIINGTFKLALTLAEGANEYLFEAVDTVGNKSTYSLTLYGGSAALNAASSAGIWAAVIIGAIAAIVFIVIAIILVKKRDKLKAFSLAPVTAFFTCTSFAAAAALIYQTVHKSQMVKTANSAEFANIAQSSIREANDLLVQIERMDGVIKTHVTVLVVSLLLLAASAAAQILLPRLKQKKEQNKK